MPLYTVRVSGHDARGQSTYVEFKRVEAEDNADAVLKAVGKVPDGVEIESFEYSETARSAYDSPQLMPSLWDLITRAPLFVMGAILLFVAVLTLVAGETEAGVTLCMLSTLSAVLSLQT